MLNRVHFCHSCYKHILRQHTRKSLTFSVTNQLAIFPSINNVLQINGSRFMSFESRDKLYDKRPTDYESRDELYEETLNDELEPSDKYEVRELVDRYFHNSQEGHQVLIIQPFIRSKTGYVNTNLLLDESRALCETLSWKVVDEIAIGLNSFDKRHLFGSGNLDQLSDIIANNHKITAVFISMYQLSGTQRIELESLFQVPVIDRYHLVLQIFYQHARTKESKLQVALAEVPYLKNRLIVQYQIERDSKHSSGNLGELYFESKRFVLRKLETGIKKKIEVLRAQRQKLRDNRKKNEIPTVAVIGYTNCGKTSLIKSLTGDNLEPKDQLFATLDVTCHGTRLPITNLETVFIDTVGFISDIPTPLIASFSSTLEDALDADLLLHVRDFSHPDLENQNNQVLSTISRLGIPKSSLENMIVVGNKIDKVKRDKWLSIKESGAMPVSATLGHGLNHLTARVEDRIVKLTNRMNVKVRVRPGSDEWEWLRNHSSIGSTEVCPQDGNFYLVNIIISRSEWERFKAAFINNS